MRRASRPLLALAGLTAATLAAGCSGGLEREPNATATTSTTVSTSTTASTSTTPSGAQATGSVPRLHRVAVVMMENHEANQVLGHAPWISKQARENAQATEHFGERHPSLPNYMAILGGSLFGIHTDCTKCHVAKTNLVDQLERAGVSWRAYMESMPTPCFKPKSSLYGVRFQGGTYVKTHNPFFYFDDIRSNSARCKSIVPYSRLQADIASKKLPRFIWITPNLCHDMHDCSVKVGDRWAKQNLPPLIHAMGPDSVVFLNWDEGTTNASCCGGANGGKIPLVALGPAAAKHAVETVPNDQYSLTRTIDAAFGLPPLRHARTAVNLAEMLR